MKKILFASLTVVVLMGAGCTANTSVDANVDASGMDTDTSVDTSASGDMDAPDSEGHTAGMIHVVGNSEFTLVLPGDVDYKDRENGGRWQNFVSDDSPEPLGEGEYFIEYTIDTTSDLEFNDRNENIVSLSLDGQVLDKGMVKDEYHGGDTTKYIVSYFRAGNGDDVEPVIFYIYADTQSGIAAGEASLKDITWSE